jgi:uncharacterized iron-regulated membrane protein
VIFIDPRTRAILYRADRSTRTAGDTFVHWQRIVHEGGALGVPGRVVTFLGGVLPPLLMVTGLMIWLRTRGKRRTIQDLDARVATEA